MDRYEVKRKIGQGSFGNVYLTIHRKTRRTLVLKEIKGGQIPKDYFHLIFQKIDKISVHHLEQKY